MYVYIIIYIVCHITLWQNFVQKHHVIAIWTFTFFRKNTCILVKTYLTTDTHSHYSLQVSIISMKLRKLRKKKPVYLGFYLRKLKEPVMREQAPTCLK